MSVVLRLRNLGFFKEDAVVSLGCLANLSRNGVKGWRGQL